MENKKTGLGTYLWIAFIVTVFGILPITYLIYTKANQEPLSEISISELGNVEFGTIVMVSGSLQKTDETVQLTEQRVKIKSCVGGMGTNPTSNCNNMGTESVSVNYHVYSLSSRGNSITVLSKNDSLPTGQVTLTGNWTSLGLFVAP